MNVADSAGQSLGEYELLEVIGQGGMAVVYRARQARIDRDVAVKVIIPPYSTHPKLVKRFEDEARAVAKMQHPHILPVLDVGVSQNQPFMVMSYVSGGTLTQRIQATPKGLDLFTTLCIATDIAEALDYAHAQGVIHRDVKPGNVLLDTQGHAYLADFGVALLIGENSKQEQQTPGTYAYMAPEVAYGGTASRASDIYALGMVVFEMLAGKRAYDVRERHELIAALTNEEPPDLGKHRADLPPGVRVAVMQATASDPESRPARATSLALALTRAAGLDRLPCPPRRPDSLVQGASGEPKSPTHEINTPPPESRMQPVRVSEPSSVPRLADEDMTPPPPSVTMRAKSQEAVPTRPAAGIATRPREIIDAPAKSAAGASQTGLIVGVVAVVLIGLVVGCLIVAAVLLQ